MIKKTKFYNLRTLSPLLLMVLLFCSCENDHENDQAISSTINFKVLEDTQTGVSFQNILDESKIKNPFNYVNAYNGGGVGIGDINNDGLPDIVLTGNMEPSKLYLNEGDMKFKDITNASGFVVPGWATGVVMSDINNDGWLDIYICRSYADNGQDRANLCFINNQDGSFKELSKQLGIDDDNYSIGASFFDFDKDGDLDLIVANHPRYRLLSQMTHYNYLKNPVKEYSSRLYRNDGSKFIEVTNSAGILSYGFCLAVVTSDYNLDGWPDIFLTVDHNEDDILFENNRDGTFTNVTRKAFKQNSLSSMGVDVGYVNNDIYPDYLVVEMLPSDYYREKISMSMQSVDKFNFLVDTLNYNYFQMRNFLHMNNGNSTFSDVSQMAGVHKSDWSWSCLFMDADNDSEQDIFIANGFYKDIFNKDRNKNFHKKMASLNGNMEAMNKLASKFAQESPTIPVPNVFFKKTQDGAFVDKSLDVGLTKKTISTGAAYGDLDLDGDLDLVVNNIGQSADIIENQSKNSNNYLSVDIKNTPQVSNTGALVCLVMGQDQVCSEILSSRGYQSSSEQIAHFGLGQTKKVDQLEITWSNGKKRIIQNPKINQRIVVEYKNVDKVFTPIANSVLVKKIPKNQSGITFKHKENKSYNDYLDQVLLPHKMSEQGPFLSIGDVDKNGLDDFYIGGAKDQAGALYLQTSTNKFSEKANKAFQNDKKHEDAGSAFFDADGDGDLDLLVGSAGYEFPENSERYNARLYLNQGNGSFIKSSNALPNLPFASSCVEPADFDKDGDIDVFIGGLLTPKKYPKPGKSIILENLGNGKFEELKLPDMLTNYGMVKDAVWKDLNHDGNLDLMIVGEWTNVSFWIQKNKNFVNKTDQFLANSPTGWWNHIHVADLDNNGLDDFVIGNLGLNYKYKASNEKPFKIYGNDIDSSGTFDIVLSTFYGETEYPVRGKTCSAEQVPSLGNEFKTYHDFSVSDLSGLYGRELNNSLKYEANSFESVIVFQTEKSKYEIRSLPYEAQMAPINAIESIDINDDQLLDLVVGGNLYQSEIETGRADYGTGQILINQGNKNFDVLKVHESGFYIPGDVKAIKFVNRDKEQATLVVANNNDECQLINFSN